MGSSLLVARSILNWGFIRSFRLDLVWGSGLFPCRSGGIREGGAAFRTGPASVILMLSLVPVLSGPGVTQAGLALTMGRLDPRAVRAPKLKGCYLRVPYGLHIRKGRIGLGYISKGLIWIGF